MAAKRRKASAQRRVRLVSERIYDIWKAMETWETEELQDFLADLDMLTTTNCWCVEYQMKGAMRQIASDVLGDRARRRVLADAALKGG